jgi:hypothetical protein
VVFLGFAVAVVAASATYARGTLGTVGISALVLLVVLPIAGAVRAVQPWLPSTLMRAPALLVTGAPVRDYLTAAAVSLVATAALLALATRRARHREPAP